MPITVRAGINEVHIVGDEIVLQHLAGSLLLASRFLGILGILSGLCFPVGQVLLAVHQVVRDVEGDAAELGVLEVEDAVAGEGGDGALLPLLALDVVRLGDCLLLVPQLDWLGILTHGNQSMFPQI